MDKTKFWFCDELLFTSKLEAEYHNKLLIDDCYCKGQSTLLVPISHRCGSKIIELDLATIIKDKKYRKFLDAKLLKLIDEKNITISETVKLEKDIEEVKKEQELTK